MFRKLNYTNEFHLYAKESLFLVERRRENDALRNSTSCPSTLCTRYNSIQCVDKSIMS